MFLVMLGHNERNRIILERFQHSPKTVSCQFHRVLMAIVHFSMSNIVPPSFVKVPTHISTNPKYMPWFKNYIGAIDGTHIDAYVPAAQQIPYISHRKGITQNAMAACSFYMCFTFAYVGWEGTTNDSRILHEAITNPDLNFPHAPHRKCYVVDAGYANTTGFLAPYRKTCYHIPAFRNGPRPRGKMKLFNYVHSSLRNVIECCFGVLKKKWPIL